MIITGSVIRGDGIAGATFGIPTANLSLPNRPGLTPGVYVGFTILDDKTYQSLICFDADTLGKFEVHLFNFTGGLFNTHLSVDVQSKISDLIPWTTKEAMQQKINNDVIKAKAWFATQDSPLVH